MKLNNGMIIELNLVHEYKEWNISESVSFDDDQDCFWFYITSVLCGFWDDVFGTE